MGLFFDGTKVETLDGFSLKAEDEHTRRVVPVRVSHEVMQDHEIDLVQALAEEKYDNGILEQDGSVSVNENDFRRHDLT